MGQQGVYFELLDWLDRQDRLEPSTFLLKLQSRYTTGDIIYVDGAIGSERLKLHRVVHSRSSDGARAARLLLERPLLEQLLRVFAALEPVQIDLGALSRSRSPRREPTDLHIPAHGVGYPLISRPGGRACLLVQAKHEMDQWPDWRRRHDRDVLSLAVRFHALMAKDGPPKAPRRRFKTLLTRRESETLAWIAAGKSYWEAAIILGISERTVRYFMANARHKLDVVNNAQAVAEAVWQGLIPRLSDWTSG
ncbi:MAG: helix-turn-helix domain-containing protein [Rhizobium sp.]|nr:helix-turn-helix domain-containing protein [Rhizobium sp.]